MSEKLNARTFEKGPLVYEVYRLIDYDTQPDELIDSGRYEDADPARVEKYKKEDAARLKSFQDEWNYLGVCCDIRIKTATNWAVPHKVGSASLWGIESDSGEAYFAQVEAEMIAEAEADLEKTIAALAGITAGEA